MQRHDLKYAGNEFIKNDFRRLKVIKSLENDLLEIFKWVQGLVEESSWPPPYDFCGGLITELQFQDERFICFKVRVPTTRPKLSPSNGCRLIYAFATINMKFIPLLLYRASEEGKDYSIAGKKFKITSSNLGKIINEKLVN